MQNTCHHQRNMVKNGVEVIVDKNGTKWINANNIKGKYGHVNFALITRKYLLK